ncbi:MAG: hypothetical protein VX230_00450, partial [Candidatus Thermoplasmatota archaeon]|nr:hypothetical protein [Candidatus Thermoplasmatota archaeon]
AFGLSSGDHLALHGLRSSLKTSKSIAVRYEESQIIDSSPGIEDDLNQMDEVEGEPNDGDSTADSAQKSLDFF